MSTRYTNQIDNSNSSYATKEYNLNQKNQVDLSASTANAINDNLIANFLQNKRLSVQFGPPSPDSITTSIGNIQNSNQTDKMLPGGQHLDNNETMLRGYNIVEDTQGKKFNNNKGPPSFLSLHPEAILSQSRPSFGFGGEFPAANQNVATGDKLTNVDFKQQNGIGGNPTLQRNQPRISFSQQDLLSNRRPSFNLEQLLSYPTYPLLNNRRDSLGMLSVTDPNDAMPRSWMEEDFLNNFQFDVTNGEGNAQLLDHRRKSYQLFQNSLEQRRNSSIPLLSGFVPHQNGTGAPNATERAKLLQESMQHFYKQQPQNLHHSIPPHLSTQSLDHVIRPVESKRKEPEHEEKPNMPDVKRARKSLRSPKISPTAQTKATTKRTDNKRSKRKTGTKQVRNKTLSSIFRGVSRCSKDGRWQARIRIGPQVKYLGRFKTQEEAAKCYDVAAKEYHKERAVLNYNPDGTISKAVKAAKR